MATNTRQPLRLEHLEPRETPDVSFHPEAVLSAPPPVPGQGTDRIALLGGVPAVTSRGDFTGTAPLFQVDAFFSDPLALKGYLSGFSPTLPEGPAAFPDDYGQGTTSWRGAADSDLTVQGWSFLRNYTQKAIRNDETRRGPLPDHEDVVQEVYLEWRLEVGSGKDSLANLLTDDSVEREVLRVSVPRVIARARYQAKRQSTMQELTDRPAPVRPDAQDWQDWRIDSEGSAAGLSGRDRRIVERRVEGATFEEIGRELGLPKQRACEAFNAALARLRKVYAQAV